MSPFPLKLFQISCPQSLSSHLSIMFFLFSLKPLDVEFMKAIHSKVNIVPVIAKADTLTLRERDRLKRRVSVIQTVQCCFWTFNVFRLSAMVVSH